MAEKKDKKQDSGEKEGSRDLVVSQDVVTEMKDSYLDYAMSVITARALPDVRDGLKPVQRRILFTLNELGLSSGSKTRKSAKIIGDVTGNYHPHGTAAAYGALVNLAQDFSMRYPLVIGQGNFGSIDGDPPAADRYTEAKMARISSEMLKDIEKDTVDWRPNYEGTRKEPVVLPSSVPNLLLNGTLGIAVGMATNVAPHNLKEVFDAVIYLVDHKNATTEDLLQFIKGPDFPTGGIVFSEKDINHAEATGRGGVVVRGEAEIIENKTGQPQIIISSLPYRVNKADLIMKIADLVREKKIEGVKGLRDESAKDIRVVIDLKGTAHPQNVLNYLYKHTQLEETFHYNTVALVDGVPQIISLKGLLEEFLKHRVTIVRRRTEFDLKRAQEKEHILLGLKKALEHIDEIIKLIKASKDVQDAHKKLKQKFKFSDIQATAILEMKLQKLASLERKKIEEDLKNVQELIKKLKAILADPKEILKIIKDEFAEIRRKYGDERRTKVVKGGVKNLSVEDLIPEEENVLTLTFGGYIKRSNPSEFKRQKRGGIGVIDLNTKEEDFVTKFLTASTHDDLLFFTDKGKVYQTKMYDVPEGRRSTKGKSIMNFLPLETEEKITSIVPMSKVQKNKTGSLLMVTKEGVTKRVSAESFHDVRRGGIIAIKLSKNDELVSASFCSEGEDAIVVTVAGQSIRFKDNDIREMGRSAGGVRAIRLSKNDYVVSAQIIKKDSKDSNLLVISENGFGKRTKLEEYKTQKRGGSGIKTANVTSKTGKIMSAWVITGEENEIVAVSQKGQVIRIDIDEIPVLGRQTQGVRIMKLREKDKIASMVCF